MNREQIEKDIRAINRRCKGPYLLNEEDRAKLSDELREMDAKRDFDAGMQFKANLKHRLKQGRMAINKNDHESLFRRNAELVYAHTEKCNYDFNDVILANPLDGEERVVSCPNCETQISYRAPNYSAE